MLIDRSRTTLLIMAVLAATAGCQNDKPAASAAAPPAPSTQPSPQAAMIARAKTLELNTPYVPPPGNALEHHASGFAKTMCSAVFITGLDPDFAAENVGYFTAPYAERAKLGKPIVDRGAKSVSVSVPNGATLTAKYFGSQGCVTLPVGQATVSFTPVAVKSVLPDASKQAWPMGDLLPTDPLSLPGSTRPKCSRRSTPRLNLLAK